MAKTSVENGRKQKPEEWEKREDKNEIVDDSGKLIRELSQLRSNISNFKWELRNYIRYRLSLGEGGDYFSVNNALKALESTPDDLMKMSSTIETLHAHLIS